VVVACLLFIPCGAVREGGGLTSTEQVTDSFLTDWVNWPQRPLPVYLRDDPNAPFLREMHYNLAELVAHSRRGEQRRQTLRPSLQLMARQIQASARSSFMALVCHLVELLNSFFSSNPLVGFICLPCHFLTCFCTLCYYIAQGTDIETGQEADTESADSMPTLVDPQEMRQTAFVEFLEAAPDLERCEREPCEREEVDRLD